MAAAEAYAYYEPYITSERGSYKPQTLPIFERGAQTKTSDYIRMWRELQSVRRTVDEGFQNVDLLITPTRRIPRAVDAEIKRASSEKPLFPDPENTRPFNAFGLPTISIPCGFSKDGDPDRSANQWAAFGDVNVLALLMLMNTPPNGITRAAVDSRNQVAGACNNGRVQPGIFMNRIVDPSSLQTRLGQVPVRQFA